MSERTFLFELGHALRDAVQATFGEHLSSAIRDDDLRAGLLEGLVHALSARDRDPALERVPVTVRTAPAYVEVEIEWGRVRDTLVCTG